MFWINQMIKLIVCNILIINQLGQATESKQKEKGAAKSKFENTLLVGCFW
jgi:hypothetical protein